MTCCHSVILERRCGGTEFLLGTLVPTKLWVRPPLKVVSVISVDDLDGYIIIIVRYKHIEVRGKLRQTLHIVDQRFQKSYCTNIMCCTPPGSAVDLALQVATNTGLPLLNDLGRDTLNTTLLSPFAFQQFPVQGYVESYCGLSLSKTSFTCPKAPQKVFTPRVQTEGSKPANDSKYL